MKAIVITGIMAVLLVAAVPAFAMDWGKMAPSETQDVDTTGTPFEATPSSHYMDVSESQKVDTSGTPWVAVKSPKESWKIEQLVPSETQEVIESGATR